MFFTLGKIEPLSGQIRVFIHSGGQEIPVIKDNCGVSHVFNRSIAGSKKIAISRVEWGVLPEHGLLAEI